MNEKENVKIDNNANKKYQEGRYETNRELSDFFEDKSMFGVAITKGNKVLFAENYKTYNKAKEAYNTAIAMQKVYGYESDNELTFHMWNGSWFFDVYCLLTEEFSEQCDELSRKWFDFLYNERTLEERKQIKEVRFNKKNYELISRKGCIGYLNGYPVIIDETVTDDFKVIFEDIGD